MSHDEPPSTPADRQSRASSATRDPQGPSSSPLDDLDGDPGDATELGTAAAAQARRYDSGRVRSAVSSMATWSLWLLLISAAAVLIVLALARLWVVVLPVLLGLLLASVLWTPTAYARRLLKPAAAALLVLFVAALALIGVIAWIVPQVAEQAPELADAVSGGLVDLQQRLAQPPFNIDEGQIDATVAQISDALQGNAQTIASGVLTGVTAAGSLLLTGVLAIVLCFFFLKDGPKFLPWASDLVGTRAAPHTMEIAVRSWRTLSGFIKAQAAVGAVDAVAIGIGLVVLDVPLALPLAVIVFLGGFIPIVGATVSGALAALVALVSNGLTSAIIVVVLVLVVQQLEGNVLQPILVGRTLALHPAVVVLAVTAGGSLFGIIGAFLSVPVVAVATTVIRYTREQASQSGGEGSGLTPPRLADDA